jgi:predicted NAD/FAD-dependent oxidoreductase
MGIESWDVAVIGGGAAGVAAAKSLDGVCQLVLLEGTDRLGGRIYSPIIGDYRCELGATVGYNSAKLPFAVHPTAIVAEAGDMALRIEGRLARGRTPEDCLLQAAKLFQMHELFQLGLHDGRVLFGPASAVRSPRDMTPIGQKALQALFNVMNPGDVFAYDSSLWVQAVHRFHPSHHVGGNIEFIDELAAGLNIRCASHVETIVDDGDWFTISGRSFALRARGLIVATDAAVASTLLQNVAKPLADTTAAVGYGTFVVLATEIAGQIAKGATSYLVDADSNTAICAQLHTPDQRRTHRLTLFSGRLGKEIPTASDDEIVAAIGDVVGQQLARWPRAGTVISPDFEALVAILSDHSACDGRLAVAGDYMSKPYYGIQAAVASGVAAAAQIKLRLNGCQPSL